MPKVKIHKTQQVFDFPEGAPLMWSLLNAKLPVASSCQGKGICGKCALEIKNTSIELEPPSPLESNTMENNKVSGNCRLSCQIKINCDMEVDAPYW